MQGLHALLNPQSIAVVGASEGPRHGAEVIRSLQAMGYPGRLLPVNPKYQVVYGLACYPSVSAIPEPVDCVVIAISKSRVIDVLREAGDKGAKAALIISAGFAEIGPDGEKLQAELRRIARDRGIRLCGPNSLGLINMRGRVALYSASLPKTLKPGGVGVVSQSGSVLGAIAGANRGIGFSYLISSGNEADVSASEYIQFLIQDPNTAVVAGFIEGFRDGARFVRAAELALVHRKPLIILKVGRTPRSQEVALTHTGALAGSDAVHDALFRQKGVVRAHDMDELLETIELFWGLKGRLPSGEGVGILTISGGEGGLVLDLADEVGLALPHLSPATQQALAAILPPFAIIDNPLDVTGVGAVDRTIYSQALGQLVEDEGVHTVAVMQDVRPGHWIIPEIAAATANIARTAAKPVVFFSNVSRAPDNGLQNILGEGGVPFLKGTRETVRALTALTTFGRHLREAGGNGAESFAVTEVQRDQVAEELCRLDPGVLDEHASRRILAHYGIPLVREALASSRAEALDAARMLGYPVALKVNSTEIPHKSEVGALALNIPDAVALEQAYDNILTTAQHHVAVSAIKGVIVQPMVPAGVEVIAGLKRDPQFGPTLVFGLGGIFAELLSDVALRVLPATRDEVRQMIYEIRGGAVLHGVRGQPRLDVEAVVDALWRLALLGHQQRQFVEQVDVNPLIVYPEGKGVIGVDALVVLTSEAGDAL
jgi:acyl-CoA synthetase (NDP forming)